MLKRTAAAIVGGLTQTSKMPCPSYSLPTIACKTGFRMAKISGSICSLCYADRGFYAMYRATIEPAQVARLFSLDDAQWADAMVTLIYRAPYFRWHDSGDIQSLDHLEQIADVAARTPECQHWLPTREYSIVAAYLAQYGDFPSNLCVRLSAMFADKPVKIPASIDARKVGISNVHSSKNAIGHSCPAYTRGGKCGDCRACWDKTIPVSYPLH